MTPAEIAQWKAEQKKKPLAQRLAEIPGHRPEAAPAQIRTSPPGPSATVGFEDAKQLQQQK